MANDKETQMQVANTILAQLGGRMFSTMTGAKNFLALESGLQFQLPRTTGVKVRAVRVVLEVSDLYTVTFHSAKGDVLASFENVYADMLRGMFETQTGLRTSLSRVFA